MIKKIFLLAFLTTSCTNIPLPLYQAGYEGVKEAFFNLDSQELTEDYMRSKKYPIIRMRFGNSRSVILVLVNEVNGVRRWISADRIKIFTFNGKIISTEGLPNDFKVNGYEFPKDLQKENSTKRNYIVDFYEPRLLNLYATSIFTIQESENISNPIIDRPNIEANKMEETVYIEGINSRFKNLYYFSKEGKILRSEQIIHPFLKRVSVDFVDAYYN